MNTTDTGARKRVHVAVGVIYGTDGKILVAQRAAQQHLGGLWEFPGGKVEAGESVNDALVRELQEELGITPESQTPLCRISHDYSDKFVLLDVWNVNAFQGSAQGREGQPLRWLSPHELRHEDFPEANRAIIRAIQLQDYLALLPAESDIHEAKQYMAHLPASCLVRLRQTDSPLSLPLRQTLLDALAAAPGNAHRGIIVDLTSARDESWQTLSGLSGVHANRHVLAELTGRPVPEHLLFGASCHDAVELQQAAACGADYVLLSPVKHSLSHPEQHGMGWCMFEQLTRSVDISVYAMGGLNQSDIKKARSCGARGIAGIRLFNGS